MVGQRRRRCTHITTELVQCLCLLGDYFALVLYFKYNDSLNVHVRYLISEWVEPLNVLDLSTQKILSSWIVDCIVNDVISNECIELGYHGCWEKLALSQQTALFLHC